MKNGLEKLKTNNDINTLITLNINWLKHPLKSQRLSDWKKKSARIQFYAVYKHTINVQSEPGSK